MKTFTFYRQHRFNPTNACRGYVWFTSRASAQRAATAWRRSSEEDVEYNPDYPDHLRWTELEVITITPTKAGLLDALNEHADNDCTEE